MKFMPLKGADPLAIIFRPRLLQNLFPSAFAARPESNRGKLRDILLESLASRGNAAVHFDSKAFDVREVTTEGGSMAEVLDESGQVLGEYDLVVDATGLHSTLRQHFVDDKKGKQYSGRLMMHGAFLNPEATFPPELLARIDNAGTFMVAGKGYGLCLQRYGGGPGDSRMSMFYTIPDREDGEGSVFDEIGIDKPTSRKSGIISDAESLAKVREWMKQDMGDVFDPVYLGAVDKLSRVTIRGEYEHGETDLRDDVTMPLVCIGDSLRNCGLGGGGILAMQDALELADLIENGNALNASGRANIEPLRAAAKVMLGRKNEHMQKKQGRVQHLMRTRPDGDKEFCLKDFIQSPFKRVLMRLLLYCIAGLFKRWYRFEKFFYGSVGSSSTSPIYPNVRKALVR
jgi:2-polyprenyl-6-methoxyphenol hydroxylase-like FAD-dependent oxidoreductase